MTLGIRMLGGLRVERGDRVVDIGPQPVRTLLAYLLVHRDRPNERAQVAFQLWPDSDERQARTNLRKTIHQLRRSLSEADRVLALDGRTLRVRRDTAAVLDVERFEQAIERARGAQASDDLGLERERLEAALRAYRGDLLPEMYDAWLEPERERLRGRCAQALERLVDVLWRHRDDRAALGYAQRLVRHDPLVEASHRRLMRVHVRLGEPAKALHAYHSCASVLHEQLQVAPGHETTALYEDVLRLGPSSEAHLPTAVDEAPRNTMVTGAPLVGRGHELNTLTTAWHDTLRDRSRLVLVTGDPGIGKTRLVEEFVRSIRRGHATTFATRCHEVERSLAFGPVVDLLRTPVVADASSQLAPVWRREVSRLLPELDDDERHALGPLREGWQRRRLFEAITNAVLAHQPLVAFIDDVQWCDGDSLDWFHHLLRAAEDARRMLVATARTHELAANTRVGALIRDLERDGLVTRIDLEPLDHASTATLARSLHPREPDPDALAALVDETEGNPLFVVEMVREGALTATAPGAAPTTRATSTLPKRLHSIIAARLERTTPTCSELLRVAAVIGREFDVDLLVRVSRRDEDAVVRCLDELWRSRIVRERGAGQYDFSHDKLREVAYQASSRTQRRLLHRYTAEALEAIAGDVHDDLSGRIAFHYDKAGSVERAVTYYRRAGAAARDLYAHEEATRVYERGLALLERLPPSAALHDWRRVVAADLHEGLGEVFDLEARHAEAREHFERALAHANDDAIRAARAWRRIGRTFTAQYHYAEAEQAFAAAEAALSDAEAATGPSWWHEWIDVNLARSNTYYWMLDWRASERVLATMQRAVERYGTALQRCFYYRDLADADFARSRFVTSPERLTYSLAALEAAEASGSRTTIATAHFSLSFAYLWKDDGGDDVDAAHEHLETALSMSEATGESVLRARCLTYLCFLHRRRGDDDATERVAHESLRTARELEMPEYVGAAHGHLAWLAWRRRDHAACAREGHAALRCWTTGQRYPLQWCARMPLLAASVDQGHTSDALVQAAAMLEPEQQRLPDDLTEALTCAVRAEDDPDGRATALRRSVAAALVSRHL